MKLTSDYVEYIIGLAKDVELGDPIDWGLLNIDEDNAYRLITTNTIEMLQHKYNESNYQDVIVATIVKLIVENFCLNLQLMERSD